MGVPFPLPDIILSNLRASRPREVIRTIAGALGRTQGIDAAAIATHLTKAEDKGGSTIGDGIAVLSTCVPASLTHTRLCALVRLARPVRFRGIDEHPCDLVFVLISPDSQVQAHLRDLSVIIRGLREPDMANTLRMSATHDRILTYLEARAAAMAQAA